MDKNTSFIKKQIEELLFSYRFLSTTWVSKSDDVNVIKKMDTIKKSIEDCLLYLLQSFLDNYDENGSEMIGYAKGTNAKEWLNALLNR